MPPDAPPALVCGTSSQTWATNPRDGFAGWFPAGRGHAVPFGSTQALCGLEPPHVWDGPFDRRSRVLAVCPRCAALAPADDPLLHRLVGRLLLRWRR